MFVQVIWFKTMEDYHPPYMASPIVDYYKPVESTKSIVKKPLVSFVRLFSSPYHAEQFRIDHLIKLG